MKYLFEKYLFWFCNSGVQVTLVVLGLSHSWPCPHKNVKVCNCSFFSVPFELWTKELWETSLAERRRRRKKNLPESLRVRHLMKEIVQSGQMHHRCCILSTRSPMTSPRLSRFSTNRIHTIAHFPISFTFFVMKNTKVVTDKLTLVNF